MKTEQQIKQAARSYAELDIEIEAGYVLAARNAFIAGANFGREIGMKEAFEWISVNDNLPKNIKDDKSVNVLVKTKHGSYKVAYYDYKLIEFISGCAAIDVTHYRYINQEDMP